MLLLLLMLVMLYVLVKLQMASAKRHLQDCAELNWIKQNWKWKCIHQPRLFFSNHNVEPNWMEKHKKKTSSSIHFFFLVPFWKGIFGWSDFFWIGFKRFLIVVVERFLEWKGFGFDSQLSDLLVVSSFFIEETTKIRHKTNLVWTIFNQKLEKIFSA